MGLDYAYSTYKKRGKGSARLVILTLVMQQTNMFLDTTTNYIISSRSVLLNPSLLNPRIISP